VIAALPAGAGAVSLIVAIGRTWLRTVDSLSVIDSSAAGAGGGGGGVGVGAGAGAGAGVGTGVGAGAGGSSPHAAADMKVRQRRSAASAGLLRKRAPLREKGGMGSETLPDA
jgi:hypothetical protein